MDFLTQTERSERMSRIRGRDTRPELEVRHYLHRRGLRYVLNDSSLPGTPDLAFKSRKVAVFVHGCFWHGHAGCKKATIPKTRTDFWQAKIFGNQARDRRVSRALRRLGWRVVIVWSCDLGERRLNKVYNAITKS